MYKHTSFFSIVFPLRPLAITLSNFFIICAVFVSQKLRFMTETWNTDWQKPAGAGEGVGGQIN